MPEKPSKEDTDFWNKVLHDHGLGMNRGRRKWLSYGHDDHEKDSSGDPDEVE